ncbi:phosphoribosyl pyrophosphate synthetase [Heterostelium album PN500]|uniref:ribose-phosphate diphosphokinase n=1 Tax=Heterostelium pallidum (strain ATCC 26659 / Pp 5 / PN500) TaxID=670386 RepID=D3BTS5_HETP5|nr:phosphoribosyl pyrophosphate synthetase [Heterostelium album PN500]EFA75111.1 phosphoribosyl pyrophosphate synthetase [Heterostelium album PN500]|eukprot:XP_020427245.1 phosphoribosyl pyrophosphate synthetase [Heterostelium album PN500]
MIESIKILSGTAHRDFAEQIAKHLNVVIGKCDCTKFSNGETSVIIAESIRSKDVYIVQPTCSPNVNDNIMELLVLIDAVKRASANQVTAVIPYYGYGKQNKKERSREPITGKLIANMLETAGVNRVISMDLEASQIQGFFNIPVDNLYAEPLIVKYIEKHIKGERVVISPAVDGVKRAKLVADKLNCDLAILDRQTKDESVDDMLLVGDVTDKIAVIIGSVADTCDTLALAAKVLKRRGASKVYALVSHGELSGNAIETLNASELEELVITNSIPTMSKLEQSPKIKVINVAPMFAEAIRRIVHGESVTAHSSKFVIL